MLGVLAALVALIAAIALTAGLTGSPEESAPQTAPSRVSGWSPPGRDDGRRPVPPVALPAAYDAPAPAEPQRLCDPEAEPGTLALAGLLTATWPEVGSSGIERPCSRGGRSEHKEGRAYDWSTRAHLPHERDAAKTFLDWLTAPGTDGVAGGNARRLGVRYVIWDRHIWTVTDPQWRAYSGPNPHVDHVHITLSWAGAAGKTSFWSGRALSALEVRAAQPPIRVVRLDEQGAPRVPLRMGDVGPAVLRLREHLGLPRGSFNPGDLESSTRLDQNTWNAVVRLERELGGVVDGVVGAQEWEALDPEGRPLLTQGSRGPGVARLQDALGMSPPRGSRGRFGPSTLARVKELQAQAGLPVTGVVDPATWEALERRR